MMATMAMFFSFCFLGLILPFGSRHGSKRRTASGGIERGMEKTEPGLEAWRALTRCLFLCFFGWISCCDVLFVISSFPWARSTPRRAYV
ncbi:hypothetical protein ACQKWADRAFT_296672 [Trichoderma austrokoningii]